MRLGDLADLIFPGALVYSHMVSHIVSEINLSEERAEMGRVHGLYFPGCTVKPEKLAGFRKKNFPDFLIQPGTTNSKLRSTNDFTPLFSQNLVVRIHYIYFKRRCVYMKRDLYT